MSIINTSKIQGTTEQIGKFSADSAAEFSDIKQQRASEKDKLYATIPTGLSKEERKKKQLEIDQLIKETSPQKVGRPIKEIGKNGSIVADHKSKLAFIFIGDTKRAESNTQYDLNAPKISMIVGGGLETTVNPKTKELVKVDPRDDYIIGVTAQFHLISAADIDVTGILPISTLKNRSVVKAEADIVDISASEAVFIRSLGRPYNSSGTRVLTPGGVHIVSGQNFKDSKIKEPEPMVLGKGLSDTIFEIVDKISDINSTLISMNEDILMLKTALVAHTHTLPTPLIAAAVASLVTPAPILIVPSLPSIDLAASVAPTIVSKTVLNITNGYTNLINLEVLKTNKLTPLSAESFLSQYNRVN